MAVVFEVVVFCLVALKRLECEKLLSWRWRKYFSQKGWYPPTRLHGVTTKTTTIRPS